MCSTTMIYMAHMQAIVFFQDAIRGHQYLHSTTTSISLQNHPTIQSTSQFLAEVKRQIKNSSSNGDIVICVDDLPVSGELR